VSVSSGPYKGQASNALNEKPQSFRRLLHAFVRPLDLITKVIWLLDRDQWQFTSVSYFIKSGPITQTHGLRTLLQVSATNQQWTTYTTALEQRNTEKKDGFGASPVLSSLVSYPVPQLVHLR